MSERRGLTQIYTGDGKGKTTAAFGLALRAAGHGFVVLIVQFMKERVADPGEVLALTDVSNIEVKRFGRSFLERPVPSRADVVEGVVRGLAFAREAMAGGRYDVVILDEICTAVSLGLIEANEVAAVVSDKPERMELVLTGRDAPGELIDRADLVTEMKAIKHPHERGLAARKGIEY